MCVYVHRCIHTYSYCLLNNIFMVDTIPMVLFVEMYVHVDFVRSCLYSAVSLTQIREQCFIRIICYNYYVHQTVVKWTYLPHLD